LTLTHLKFSSTPPLSSSDTPLTSPLLVVIHRGVCESARDGANITTDYLRCLFRMGASKEMM
jgi:hypothetical protein